MDEQLWGKVLGRAPSGVRGQSLWSRGVESFSLFRGTSLIFAFDRDPARSRQESLAVADKPARREIMPKIAPIRRAYNVVADNTGLSPFI